VNRTSRSQRVVQAHQLATQARDVTGSSERATEKVAAAMSAITESSVRLADMIDVIEQLSFKTSLLAVNATVEAARAGDQGRGFATVATDLRHLAQRCSTAVREIKAQAQDNMQSVGQGARLAHQSGTALRDVAISVKHVTEIIAEIAANEVANDDVAVTELHAGTQNTTAKDEVPVAAEQACSPISLTGYLLRDDLAVEHHTLPATNRSATGTPVTFLHAADDAKREEAAPAAAPDAPIVDLQDWKDH